MQVCEYCKTENDDDHKFCKECGNRLKSLVAVEVRRLEEGGRENLDLNGMKGKAFVYSTRGKYDQAIDELTRAIRFHPHVPELHYQLGIVLYKNGQIENSVNEFERTISLDPKHFKAHLKLGNIYGEDLRNHEMAIKIYSRAVDLRPDYPDLRNNLGNAFRFIARHAEAAEQFEKAVELNPRYARARFNLGKTYSALGEFDKARRQYEEAIEIDRNHPKAFKNLGDVLVRLGDDDRAAECYRLAVDTDPSYVNARVSLAQFLAERGETTEAEREAREALALRPELGSVEKIITNGDAGNE